MLKVKKRIYHVDAFAKMLNLGSNVHLLFINIENMGRNDDQFVTIEYVVKE